MATYRYVVEDVLKLFKQTQVTSNLKRSQVLFWAQSLANRYRAKHIEKGYLTGAYLNIFKNVPVEVSLTTTGNLIQGRKYFELPTNIYDFQNEKAIDYVTYETLGIEGFRRIKIQPTYPDRAERLEYSAYERPSPSNPYFYRVHQFVYLLGVDNVTIKTVEVGLYSSLLMKTNLVDLDSEIDLDEQSLSQLRMDLLALGKFMMLTPAEDRVNDGSEDIDIARTALERVRTSQPQPEE